MDDLPTVDTWLIDVLIDEYERMNGTVVTVKPRDGRAETMGGLHPRLAQGRLD